MMAKILPVKITFTGKNKKKGRMKNHPSGTIAIIVRKKLGAAVLISREVRAGNMQQITPHIQANMGCPGQSYGH
jgi:hypothetical protein